MGNRKFGWLMFAITLVCGAVGGGLYTWFAQSKLYWGVPTFGRIVVVALFFVLPLCLSALGAFVAQAIRRKSTSVRRVGSRLLSILLAVVASFIVGGLGQYLYMLDWSKKQNTTVDEAADIVLLIDCSTSMSDCFDTCLQAAVSLAEQIGEKCSVQAIAFSSDLVSKTELLPMDPTGREQLISYILSLHMVGGTDFDIPLQAAGATLEQSTTGNDIKAVIMLTDGISSVRRRTKEMYKDSEVPVYSISLVDPNALSLERWLLTSFIKSTGGFDTEVPKDSMGNTDLSAVVAAFEKAYTSSLISGKTNNAIVTFGMYHFNFARAIIRLLTLAAYAVICQMVFFKRLDKSSLISIPAMTLLSFVIICLTGLGSYMVGLIGSTAAFVFIFWTVYALYNKVAATGYMARKR